MPGDLPALIAGEYIARWVGLWDPLFAYQVNDICFHVGDVWKCSLDNSGDEPGASASWAIYESLGPRGPQGLPPTLQEVIDLITPLLLHDHAGVYAILAHTHPPAGGTPLFVVPLLVNPTVALTNAPAAGVEPAAQQSRVIMDLQATVNCQVQALFSVIPTGTCRVEYSINAGSSWAALADSGAPHVANVLKAGAVTPVPALAKTSTTMLRVMVTGNTVADPVLQKAVVTFIG